MKGSRHRLSDSGYVRQGDPEQTNLRLWEGTPPKGIRRPSEGYGANPMPQDSPHPTSAASSELGSPRTICSQRSIDSEVMQICLPPLDMKRDGEALRVAASFYEDQDFQEECQAALATNTGTLKGRFLEGEIAKLKECLEKAVYNGDQTFGMLKSSHASFQRRSQHTASQLQKAMRARDSYRGLLEYSKNKARGLEAKMKETEEELRRVLAENEVLKGLLADSMAANSSQSRTGMTQANGHPPDSALKSPPSHHFCVSSWLSFFSEV